MIKEDYVSFEIAKLLKEKGFDEPCHTWQRENENISYCDILLCSNDMSKEHNEYLVPTQQMAMRWLREVHNIYIDVLLLELKDGDYGYVIEDTTSRDYLVTSRDDSYQFPEEAAEAAIKYCLENLI